MANVIHAPSAPTPAAFDEHLASREVLFNAHFATGALVDIDSGGLDLLGYQAEELIGRPVVDFVHPEDRAAVVAAVANTGERGFGRCVARVRHVDGEYTRYSFLAARSNNSENAWIRAIDLEDVERTGEAYWQYSRLGALATDHFVVTDRSGLIVHMNRAACERYGLSEQEAIGRSHKSLAATEEGVESIEQNCRRHLETGEPVRFQVPVIVASGADAILECISLWDDISQRWYTIERDITAQVEQERELAIGQRFFDSAHNQLALLSEDGTLHRVNPAFEELVGAKNEQLTGRGIASVLGAKGSPDMLQSSIDWVVENQRERRLVVSASTDHGDRMLAIFLHPDPDGRQVFLSGRDITEELRLADELKDRATHDQLTRLPTREVFNEALETVLRSGFSTAVMMLDIDDFKHVNDSLGHDAGDELLIIIGARLRAALRPDDVVARFGGDEFVVLVRGARARKDAWDTAERVRVALAEPYRVANREVHVSASIGVAVGSHQTHVASKLLSEADTAAYEAKHRGRNQVQMFGPKLAERTRRRIDVERHLRAALENEEIDCDVQTVFDTATGEVAGVEVFARMLHTYNGRVGPSQFLDVARHLGLLGALGERVMDVAMRSLARWLGTDPNLWISFNVDPEELAGRTYAATLQRLAKRNKIDPRQIVVELREAGFGHTQDRVARALDQLISAGFRVCIDNFGAASTSLGYLRSARVQRVKIDMSYVHAMETDPMSSTIVRTVIDLAHDLGVEVVAEGVETEGQVELLRGMGCDLMQGYLLHRPIPVEFYVG